MLQREALRPGQEAKSHSLGGPSLLWFHSCHSWQGFSPLSESPEPFLTTAWFFRFHVATKADRYKIGPLHFLRIDLLRQGQEIYGTPYKRRQSAVLEEGTKAASLLVKTDFVKGGIYEAA
jgi:hypothetical protein